jgi:hypothetical protein
MGRWLNAGLLWPATVFEELMGVEECSEAISLHSYRYAWAERAKTVEMPERFAPQALGHSSKAFAWATRI